MNRLRDALTAGVLVSLAGAPLYAQGGSSGTTVRVGGEGQMRWTATHAWRATAAVDRDESGFQLRRARLVFTGTFLNPQTTFRLRPAYDRATGVIQFDDCWVAHRFAAGVKVQAGQFKPMFLREESISGFNQLAVERGYAADYFTIDYTQGVEASWDRGAWRGFAALHDGSYGATTDFANDRTAVAASGRFEVRTGGAWNAFLDHSAWGTAHGLLVGAALDWERGERNGTARLPDVFKYTVDVTAKLGRFGLFGAVMGQSVTAPDTTGIPGALDGANQRSVVAQAGWFAVRDRVELLARWEWMDWDGVYYRNSGEVVQSSSRNLTQRRLTLWTVGANWYLRQDAAKLSLDLVYAPDDAVPVANTGGGLLRSDRGGQLAVRSQLQFRF